MCLSQFETAKQNAKEYNKKGIHILEKITQDLRILEKGFYYKVLNSQQFKDDASDVFTTNEELENMIDTNSEFIYIKILSISISKLDDEVDCEVDCNKDYLDSEDYCIDYEIEIWGDFNNSSFEGTLAETGEYEKVTDLSFLDRLEEYK